MLLDRCDELGRNGVRLRRRTAWLRRHLSQRKRSLEELGAQVRGAADGLEAVAMIRGGEFYVVLCDLRMPRMDGFQFMLALRELPDDRVQPVIAMSGLTSGADHLQTEAAGFAGQVNKPFDEHRLCAAIETAIARRLARPSAPRLT